MTEQELADMAIEERNAYLDELDSREDDEAGLHTLPIFGWAWTEAAQEEDELFPDWDYWGELADDARMGN